MTTLNVGAGQAYATLASAVAASRDGDTIAVLAGTYVNDFATISTKISIVGVGGMANFVATTAPPNGKGILVTQSDVTIKNLSFSGAVVADGNGAGIRYERGNLVIEDCFFHDNQDGLLANPDPNGTIRIVDSEFSHNGAGDGYTHNLYVNEVASLVIDHSYFHDALVGHQIKSRAQSTTITNSRIYDGTAGTGSYSVDLPNGGVGVIRNNVIQQGAHSENPAIVHYGGEAAAYAGSSLEITDNVVVNDMTSSPSVRLLNNVTTVTASLIGNDIYGLTTGQIVSGPASISGSIILGTRPSLDTSSPWLTTTFFGTPGPDTLAGTTGADTMVGGAGNDIYIVNNAGDIVSESAGEGTDTVKSSIDYTLPGNVENLTLTGSASVKGVGNSLANVLTGNSGNNYLSGGTGADTMKGGAGNDTYRVNSTRDSVQESVGQGIDRVMSSVSFNLAGQEIEKLTLIGTGNINATGNSLGNSLIGNTGNNVLDGGAGADVLTGGAGSDTFVFSSQLVAGEFDKITDFSTAADTLRLSRAIFNTIAGTGTLSAAQFTANASGTAQDLSDRIVYETDTGKLFYDSNGSAAGGAVQFARLASGLSLTANDFSIV